MKEEIVRVVHLEDNPADAELIKNVLKKWGVEYKLKVTDNENDFRSILKKFKPHIVLSDYKLPAFNGIEALRIVQELCGDIPFILISGTIGEERAVEAMKMGMHDYIMKDDLVRLIPAIKRELQEANIRVIQRKEHQELVLYKKIFTNSKDAIVIINKQGFYVEQNEAHKDLLGYTTQELLERKPIIDLGEKQFNKIIKEIEKKGLYRGTTISKGKSGQTLILDVTYFPVNKKNNNIAYFIGIKRDITIQKRIEQQLKESEEKFRTYIESSPTGIFLLDKEGGFIFTNSSVHELLGYNEKELLNSTIYSILSRGSLKETVAHFEKVKNKGGSFNFEAIFKKNNDTRVHAILDSVKLSENEYLVFCKDFTRVKKYQKELIKSKEKAEESDRLKSAFLANMSHEIRTPMNGIIGFTKLLKEYNLPEDKKQKFIEIIENSSNHLMNIINDIIEISIIEANQVKIINNNFCLNHLMDDLYSFFKDSPPGNKSDIRLFCKKGRDDKTMICSDEGRIRQILYNLLCNAYKFTHTGSIEFGYVLTNNKVEFYVKDTGIGISEKAQKFIFERFRQADDSHTRIFGGTGLGLAICKGLVNKMNGKIWLESIENSGTTFYFTLPYVPVKKLYNKNSQGREMLKLDWKGKTILIAEDHELNYFFLEELLVNSGASIIWKKNGMDVVQECIQNEKIDLILMDIRMPKMDGIIAARKIRKFNQNIPIIAQTAYAFCEDREKCLKAGCNEYITKPIDNVELYSMINNYLN